MNIYRFAGIMVLISALLTWFVSQWFVLFTVFIGLNLFQYSYSGFCPAEKLYKAASKKK